MTAQIDKLLGTGAYAKKPTDRLARVNAIEKELVTAQEAELKSSGAEMEAEIAADEAAAEVAPVPTAKKKKAKK